MQVANQPHPLLYLCQCVCDVKNWRAFLDDCLDTSGGRAMCTGVTHDELKNKKWEEKKLNWKKMDFQCKSEQALKAGKKNTKMNKSFTCALLHAITHAYSEIGYLTLSTAVSLPRQGNDEFGHY